MILVERSGQNVIAVASGANMCLTSADVQRAQARLARADCVVAQLEVPLESVLTAARSARGAGALFVLNAAPARTDLEDLLGLVDVLVLNESELATLTRQAIPGGEEAAAAREVLAHGPRAVVVTLGARGAVVVTPDVSMVVPAVMVQVVDTTGAGDAFVAALAARLDGLDSLPQAARYACAAAALACTRPGAQPSMPTAAEVDQLTRDQRS